MPPAGQTVTLPRRVYQTLTSAFAAHSAEWLTRQIQDEPQHRKVMHLGDPFGLVFAWLWNDDPHQAMDLLAGYLAVLRDHNPVADLRPPVRLDEVLHGLRLALPHDFRDYDQVVARARSEVPGYYGGDPDT